MMGDYSVTPANIDPTQQIIAVRMAAGCSIDNAPGFADGFTAGIYGEGFGDDTGTVTLYENADRSGTSISQTVVSWSDTTIKVTAETTAFGNSVDTTVYVDVNGKCIAATVDVQDVGNMAKTEIGNVVTYNMHFSTNDTSKGLYYGLESGLLLDVTDLLPQGGDPACQCVRRAKNNANPRADIDYDQRSSIPGCGVLDCSSTSLPSPEWVQGERVRRAAA